MSNDLILMAEKEISASVEVLADGVYIRESNDILHRKFDPLNDTEDAMLCAHVTRSKVEFGHKFVQVGRTKELHSGAISESAITAFRLAATKEAARRYIASIKLVNQQPAGQE